MKIEDKINQSIKDSMKKKDTIRLDSLRAIKSAILLEKAKTGNKDHIEEVVLIKILQKMVKQRDESAKIFKDQQRDQLANTEIAQSKIISEFLPDQLSEFELSEIIDEVICETNSESIKDMGKVISKVNQKVSGRSTGKIIAELVKKKLLN